jgi:hypothetical protein
MNIPVAVLVEILWRLTLSFGGVLVGMTLVNVMERKPWWKVQWMHTLGLSFIVFTFWLLVKLFIWRS